MNTPQPLTPDQTPGPMTPAEDSPLAQNDRRSDQLPAGRTALASPPQVLSRQRLAEVNELYRRLALAEFATESRIGFHLAYLRTFASPRVAGLLSHTGQMQKEPRRRGTDTGLFMYELIHHGLASEVGDEVVRRLNAMHHRFSIRNDDYVWILGTFVVLGVRTIRRFGWRELSTAEVQASMDWYRELGARMGLSDVPATFEEFDRWFSDYEQTQLRSSPAGQRLIAATLDTVFDPVPRPLRPLAVRAAAVLLEEPARSALGFTAPGPLVQAGVRMLFRLRALRRRRQPNPPSWFKPGAATSIYPQGYRLNDLGPRGQ